MDINAGDTACLLASSGLVLLMTPGLAQPVDTDTIAEHTTLIRHALLAATHPAGALGRKHRALARRIRKRETDYVIRPHPAIPFTNNSVEQEILMTKIGQKYPAPWRTEKGAGHFADRRSYLQTTAKHGIQALTASPS